VSNKLPLAVDLDGTLAHGDTFYAAMLRFLRQAPWNALVLALWLARGRAFAKAQLARVTPCDPAALHYDQRVLDWLREERASGRTIVLATATDQREARRIADHLGLFRRVFASDGEVNLKSSRKAAALRAAFPRGFVYAGNEVADLAVWAAAKAAVVVNAPPNILRKAERRFKVEKIFPHV